MYTGCDTSIVFNVLFMCDLEIPDTYSPNGDGYNDLFIIEDLTYEYYSYSNMSIYNRWGDEIYKNGHYGLDGSWWDGKNTHQYDQLAPGVYFYVLKVGNKVTQKEDVYKGIINLFY
jgi:gliding motility-associated-like protein